MDIKESEVETDCFHHRSGGSIIQGEDDSTTAHLVCLEPFHRRNYTWCEDAASCRNDIFPNHPILQNIMLWFMNAWGFLVINLIGTLEEVP